MTGKPLRHSRRQLLRILPGLFVLALTACEQAPQAPGDKGKKQHLVETATVSSDNLSVVRTRTGVLRARRVVEIYTQEQGQITELPFFEGDEVRQGDVLVRLDDTLLLAQLARATSTRKQAKQNLTLLKELRSSKLVSEDEYTRAVTQLELAEADVRILNIRHAYTTIHSPISGVVSARLSEPGNIVALHEHVLTVFDPSSLMTELPVSELILPLLQVGDVAQVRIDALGDRVFQGHITRLYPSLDPVTRRGTIEVELDQMPPGAAPGQLCRIELLTHAAQRRVIPFSALRRDDQGEYVFVLDSDARAQRVNVHSGLRLAEQIEITQGLQDGQLVITRGFLGLVSGKPVKAVTRGP
jgi:membrane fusion protein (multidrug efflux system)